MFLSIRCEGAPKRWDNDGALTTMKTEKPITPMAFYQTLRPRLIPIQSTSMKTPSVELWASLRSKNVSKLRDYSSHWSNKGQFSWLFQIENN